MIGLTENAAVKVKELIETRPSPTAGLRVGVRGGGCSGFTYFLEFAEAPNKGDRELVSHDVKLFVDPKSYLYLMGTEVDFVDSLAGSGFKFGNPNARRTCGCGESFSV
jgi:iron-sulfur cluster assembly protein